MVTRADLVDPNVSPQDKEDIRKLIDRYLACDEWASKWSLPMGIIMTSHRNNMPFLLPSVRSHAKLGMWLTLAFDNSITPGMDLNTSIPSFETMTMVDSFILPYNQNKYQGATYPSYRLLKLGCQMMSNFQYKYSKLLIIWHPNFRSLYEG